MLRRILSFLSGIPLLSLIPLLSPSSASTGIVHKTQKVAAWNDRSAPNLLEPVFQPAFSR